MQEIKKTKDYTIFQKKSKRYAVRDAKKQWLHGADKVKVLVDEKLVKVMVSKPKTETPA